MSFSELILLTIVVAIIITALALFLGRKPIPNINSDEDIKELLADGRKLKAIKAYRQLHGVGLKKAKQSIEEMI